MTYWGDACAAFLTTPSLVCAELAYLAAAACPTVSAARWVIPTVGLLFFYLAGILIRQQDIRWYWRW